MGDFFYSILLILVVVGLFNFIIFWHELGHFLAARWRGVKVDRFQVWFGKPVWKKEYNGVQYGLGWLPFGGFVALPQMAPMERIEGGNREREELPPVKPIDKIIVAFAGPLFSLILAMMAAVLVWNVGKPRDVIESTVIGGVYQDSPAEKSGLQAGDRILSVNGEAVSLYRGDFEAVIERIMMTEEEQITFVIDRMGKEMTVVSEFTIEERSIFKRRALPDVGIAPAGEAIVGFIIPSKNQSPAQRAGLEVGDKVISVNGVKIIGPQHVSNILSATDFKESTFVIERNGAREELTIKPLVPKYPDQKELKRPMLGIAWNTRSFVSEDFVYPNPLEQLAHTGNMMLKTLKIVTSSKSKVGVDQLAGPIGIATTKYDLLKTEKGWYRVLFFFVFFNINLAILNMLPLPVLDGGHITLALGEMISGKAPQGRILEAVQTVFALTLISFMLFITTKDIGDRVGGGSAPQKYVWPE